MMVGNSLMLQHNGVLYQKTNEDKSIIIDNYETLLNAKDSKLDKLIHDIFSSSPTHEEDVLEENKEKVAKYKGMIKWFNGTTPFKSKISEGKLEILDIPISVPEFLAKNIYKAYKNGEDYSALLNFWRLCSLNPDPVARDDLFQFLKGGKFTLTPSGYFVAYRNVDIKEEGDEFMTKWITDAYVKQKRKKKPTNIYVLELKKGSKGERFRLIDPTEYHLRAEKGLKGYILLGALKDIYSSLADMGEKTTIYTDQHSHTFRIKIGELVRMERKACNSNPHESCSYGLHVGNKSFLRKGSFGNAGLIVIIDPSKVIAVPVENKNKMRVCEYYPIAIANYDEDGALIELDTTVFEHGYTQYTVSQIEVMLKKNDVEELKKQLIIPEGFNMSMFETHAKSLSEMMNVIKERVVKVK